MTSGKNVAEHLPLHHLELRILIVLVRGPSYGTRIVEEIEALERGRAKLYPANLYRRIRDLIAKGFLEETDAPPSADPRRTYLRPTRLGRSVARAEARRLQELVQEAARHRLLPEM